MQIEEMAMSIAECNGTTCDNCALKCKAYITCEILYDKDYRKVPDGAIILTPEERDEEVKETNKILSERDELKAENAELKSKIEELKLKCAALQMRNEVGQGISEAANNLIKNMIKVEKKKAVQEFAEKLKKRLNLGLYEWQYAEVDSKTIDELLKEYNG